jgi:hypothetical protein
LATSSVGSGSGCGGKGTGLRAGGVSGSSRVAFIGMLDCRAFEKIDISLLGALLRGSVMARLAFADGLMGRTYWYTT